MHKVIAIIIHYGDVKLTIECVRSLRKYIASQTTILIVSNAYSIPQFKLLTTEYSNVELIEIEENLGFAGNSNIGIQKAIDYGCDYILLLNNDTFIKSDIIKPLIKLSGSDERIGLISPKILFAPGYEYHIGSYKKQDEGKILWYAGGIIDWANIYASHIGVDEVDCGQYDRISLTDFATGCCLFISKRVLKDIGLFNQKYFLYFEDVDLSVRAKKAGYKIYYCPSSVIWHKNAVSTDKPGSSMHVYYQTRNRLYFGFKYASLRTKKALFFESVRYLSEGGTRQKAVIDYYLGHLGRKS